MAQPDTTFDELADVPPVAHRRRDRIAAAQIVLPLVALALVGLGWLGSWWRNGDVRYTPGPLAQVHATWDNRCDVCHVSARPLGGDHWLSSLGADTLSAGEQCQSCHAGPPHHRTEKPAEAPSCTSCHREHRGRAADLKRVTNERCTSCHRDLSRHMKEGMKTSFLNVSRFAAGDHPEFRWRRDDVKDPGRIAFNHKLHLSAGLREFADSRVPLTLADLPKDDRERYRRPGMRDHDAVQLDCAACHRNDRGVTSAKDLAGLPRQLTEPARPNGAAMLPITYDQHCQACHPLTFTVRDGKKTNVESAKLRHRLQPDEVRAWLRGFFTEQLLTDASPVLDQPIRPLPGRPPEKHALAKTFGVALQENIDAAQRILFGPSTCGKCHLSLLDAKGAKPRIEPANIPAIWYVHAKFDHAAHRAVACQTCHSGIESSRSQADVSLPALSDCRNCHAPPHRAGDLFRGGARHDCVECHRYHDGDHPLHGRVSGVRPLNLPATVEKR